MAFSLTVVSVSSISLATVLVPLATLLSPHDRRGPPSRPRRRAVISIALNKSSRKLSTGGAENAEFKQPETGPSVPACEWPSQRLSTADRLA